MCKRHFEYSRIFCTQNNDKKQISAYFELFKQKFFNGVSKTFSCQSKLQYKMKQSHWSTFALKPRGMFSFYFTCVQWRRQGGAESRIDFYIRRNLAMRKRRARGGGGGGVKFSNSYLHACFSWSLLKTLVQIVYIKLFAKHYSIFLCDFNHSM